MDVSLNQLDAATRGKAARISCTIDRARYEEGDEPTAASQPSEPKAESRLTEGWIVESIRQDYYCGFVWFCSILYCNKPTLIPTQKHCNLLVL
ncbi:unnamed protein product, partial [Mesorhabditis belari]|uniref:Uncharacterized protein n=1 Tax=Mesorhabditis belari TaxID=2138241 RepID=A0AAF3ET93_9BILA